jgi:hypothetical protein
MQGHVNYAENLSSKRRTEYQGAYGDETKKLHAQLHSLEHDDSVKSSGYEDIFSGQQ